MKRSRLPWFVTITVLVALLAIFGRWPEPHAEAQSGKQPKWNNIRAGVVPTEFGELITVNGTSGNYTMVFKDTDNNIRLIDLRGGKIPPRATYIERK